MRHAEDKLQRSIVDFVRLVAPQCLLFSVPNGGYRHAAEAQILKVTGLVPGIPDLCLLVPGGTAHFLEVKSDKGELRKEQRAILDRLMSMQVKYAVVRSLDDVRVALTYWRIPTREATQ